MIRATRRLTAVLLTGWLLLMSAPVQQSMVDSLVTRVRRRWRQLQTARQDGLATVEVAILAAVLLGLATALLAAITAVVNKHKNQIK